jgi:hypothetical protein
MHIRDLERSDIPALVSWLNDFNSSFEYPGQRPIDDECAANFFSRFIDSASQAALIAEEDGVRVATLGFSIIPHPWNGEKIFFKAFWYSAKPGAGVSLLRYAISLCRNGNISQMIVSGMDDDVGRILELNSFRPCEVNYVLDFKRN